MDYSGLKFAGLPLLAWIPLLPLLGALINLTLGRRMSRQAVHTVAIAAVAASCAVASYLVFGPLLKAFLNKQPAVIDQSVFTWIEIAKFKAELAFRLDTLSGVMIMIITFVGTLIHIYSTGYMAHEPRYAAYFGYLNLFMGAMLTLVLGSNLPVMFIGWEGVGLCSFLLIGFWYENDTYASAGKKAFVVNRIGDFCFLVGMFLLFWATKDLSTTVDIAGKYAGADPSVAQNLEPLQALLQQIQARGSLDFQTLSHPGMAQIYTAPFWGGERLAAAAGIFLFIGACGKSAQLPLYVWLPDAMAGPTPVSALIHAATMVTAGVYMVVRLSFLYSSSTTAMIVVATVGLLTALAAAFMAFAQTDLKKVLAYSTVSQLGFMFVAAGTGNWVAAIFHLGTHAFFKACLFLGAGSVMHGMEHGGSKTPGDIMTMGGLRKHMPVTRLTFMVSCLAIAGIVPFSGFFSKDEILAGAWLVHPPGWPVWYGKVLWGGLLIAALGTAFYMWRLYYLVFSGEERTEEAKHAHESPRSMTGPLVVLAFLATIAGFIGLPHLNEIKLPGITHGLSSWLEPVTAQSWNDPQQPSVAGAKDSRLAADLVKTEPNAPCCCVTPDKPLGDNEHGHGTVAACAKVNGTCPITPTKQCAISDTSDASTFGLMAIALGIGGLGIGLAWLLYGGRNKRSPSKTVDDMVAGPLHGAYEASKNKLWVDEIYDAVFVRPFKALARGLFEIADRFIIDTVAVNGIAFVVGLFGRLFRWLQNGQVQRYLAGLVIGAAAVFLVTQWSRKPTFTYELEGDMVKLHAEPGGGLVGATAKVSWDLDGDGHPDVVDQPEITVRRSEIEGARVNLLIEDPISHKRETVSRTIRFEGSEK